MQIYNIQFTRQELVIISSVLSEAPFKLVAPIIQNLSSQVQRIDEAANAQHNTQDGKDNGGGGTQSSLRQEDGDPPIGGEGVQSGRRQNGHSSQEEAQG